MKILILIAFLGLLQSSASYAMDTKAVFNGGSLGAAKERAIRENKLLIVEFSAKWCLPCQYMEKNVFLNPEVQKFSEQHAIIFQVDIDEDKNLKEEFNIESLPTIILMKATGQVLSRKEESLNAEGFMLWIEKNKNLIPNQQNTVTKEPLTDEPVQIEIPNLETKDFENDLANQSTTAETKDINTKQAFKENNFHLQTGVFTSRSNADNMVALLGMNFQEDIKVLEEKRDNGNLYKVCVGNFNNKEEAEIFRQVLEKYKVKAVIRHN